ncbi:MAG: hypothetical protein KGL35_01925, partial [Bradyrhizobium sp.]|nr:hypothetical protein [Bradyrhizobium sp.]
NQDKFSFIWNSSSSVDFYVSGTKVGSITTNVPTSLVLNGSSFAEGAFICALNNRASAGWLQILPAFWSLQQKLY